MRNIGINKLTLWGLIILLLNLISCQTDEERALRKKISSTESTNKQLPITLTSALINEYRQAELDVNYSYINETKTIVLKDFDEKLKIFEEEFGFFRSYKHMFKVLIEDEEELNDYWELKKLKYFTNQTTYQKLHDCYKKYYLDIQKLRGQISDSPQCKSIPEEIRYNIQDQNISLVKMNQHAYVNLAIEFGTDVAVWLLIMGIVAIISLVIGCAVPPTWLITIITIIISVILSICNDNNMINSIREQYQSQIEFDNTDFLNELNESTYAFYDYISK